MVWIHQRQEWPHFVWDSSMLTCKLADIRHRQGRLLGRMENLGFDLQLEANLSTLTSDVVQSSAIEGKLLDSEEVRSSIARRLGIDIGGVLSTSRDVEGIVEMMLDATQNCQQPLTKERLYNWHAALFSTGRSGMYQITVAAWRPESAGPMQVVSGPIGHQRVHFEAPPAAKLDDDMTAFLDWFEAETSVDPVLKAGLAHLWFLTIHPFEDGNGRIARAITDMVLARADGTSNRFYSMSAQIESERKTYYTQLERQQRSTVDVTNWLDWFLECLGRSIESAEGMLSAVLYKARLWERANVRPVNERQRLILNRMLDGFKGYMSTSKYAKITKCSQDTALRDIHDLLERGILVQNPSRGRSTSYRLAEIEVAYG
ncbi:MAG: Fic family protein [Cyanobacteria bacterium P01_D01_bin.44]